MNTILIKCFLLLLLFLFSCARENPDHLFQGEWHRKEQGKKAFTVQADSIYFEGIKRGFYYYFEQDTLCIQFSNYEKRNHVSLTEKELIIFENTGKLDSIYFEKRID